MVIDPEEKIACELGSNLPGRGAHCCFSLNCITKISSNRLEHALKRRNSGIDAGELIRNVEILLKRNLKGMLVASRKKGALTVGFQAVYKKMKLSKIGKPFVSEDLSPKTLMCLKRVSEKIYILPFTMNELGDLLNRKPNGVLFIDEPLLVNNLCLRILQEREIRVG